MEWLLLALAVAVIALYARRRIGELERILVFSRDYALPWYERGNFDFALSFPTQAEASAAAAQVQWPGATSTLEITPNGRWAVVWRLRARASGAWYRQLCEQIVAAGRAQGLETITVLSSVSSGSASARILLDNITFSAPQHAGPLSA
jgi:hypothetical protein